MILSRNHTRSVEVVWEYLEPGTSTPLDQHSSFDQVFLVLKGTAEVTIGGEIAPVREHDTIFVPKQTLHSVRCTTDTGLEYLFINVWPGKIPNGETDWREVYSQIHQRRTSTSG
jgi:mannose-6-phosphate isomerase-like protein (cupin superfamily)